MSSTVLDHIHDRSILPEFFSKAFVLKLPKTPILSEKYSFAHPFWKSLMARACIFFKKEGNVTNTHQGVSRFLKVATFWNAYGKVTVRKYLGGNVNETLFS